MASTQVEAATSPSKPGEHVEADTVTGNQDTFGEDTSTYSASIASSVQNYTYQNGRRYHAFKPGSYVLPNDETEQDRLDLAHHIFRMVIDGALYKAPLTGTKEHPHPAPRRILDIGTGTGLWAIEMADEFPQATVIGTDLSPIQPSWVPPNCHFYLDDASEEWKFDGSAADGAGGGKFDYIHGRAMAGSFEDPDGWLRFYKECHRNLLPGGTLEMQEYAARVFWNDDAARERCPWIERWNDECDVASRRYKKRLDVAQYQKAWMEEAGFVDVREVVYKIPIGPWAKSPRLKEIGAYGRAMMLEAVEPITNYLFTMVLGKSAEETGSWMENIKSEFRGVGFRGYHQYYFVYGRKEGGVK